MESQPIGMRVFTRTAREDYAWYPPVGRCGLICDLERLHRALVADQSADPSVFVLFGRRPRIGLIVGELLTDRMDHARTRIRNIFYVEGDQLQQPSLFRLAAELLGPSANEFKQALISYSESLRAESAAATNAIQFNIASIREAEMAVDLDFDGPCVGRQSAANQSRLRQRLRKIGDGIITLPSAFLFASTGLVSWDCLENIIPQWEAAIILSRSQTVPEQGFTSFQKRNDMAHPQSAVPAELSMGARFAEAWARLWKNS